MCSWRKEGSEWISWLKSFWEVCLASAHNSSQFCVLRLTRVVKPYVFWGSFCVGEFRQDEVNMTLWMGPMLGTLCLFLATPSQCWNMRRTGESWDVFPVETCQLCSVGKLKPAVYPREISCCLFSSDSVAQLSKDMCCR